MWMALKVPGPLGRQKLTSSGFRLARNSNHLLSVIATKYFMWKSANGKLHPRYDPQRTHRLLPDAAETTECPQGR